MYEHGLFRRSSWQRFIGSRRGFLGGGTVAIALGVACGDEGRDTAPANETVVAPSCGTGTALIGGACVAVGTLSCGEGTAAIDGVCTLAQATVPPLDFELEDEPSGYAELVPIVRSMDAADARGHLDQDAIFDWNTAGISEDQLEFLFDHGDELTEIEFKVADGVGSLLAPDGSPLTRFTRVPTGGRFTGPNAESCLACHGVPIGNSGGLNVANVMQDPQPDVPGLFNVRQTISINGGGLIQILAEDITEELQDLKAQALENPGTPVALSVEGGAVSYGTLICSAEGECDYRGVEGISPDLVVRPMGWKGNFPTIRGFSADAAFGEMGMQSDEVLWKQTTPPFADQTPDYDGDGDSVRGELSVGDITALTVYLAMQEIPTTVLDLAEAGLAEIDSARRTAIGNGEALFGSIGCADCHVASFDLTTTDFMEPSPRAAGAFTDLDLQGRVPSYSSTAPVVADLSGPLVDEPRVTRSTGGGTTIYPYTDLKRHFMGAHLADDAKAYFPKNASQFDVLALPADADAESLDSLSAAIPLGQFLTPELWGVGNTGPWMHDGRAATLREAIAQHGESSPGPARSEAQPSRDAFLALSDSEQADVLSFLRNLVLVDMADDEEE